MLRFNGNFSDETEQRLPNAGVFPGTPTIQLVDVNSTAHLVNFGISLRPAPFPIGVTYRGVAFMLARIRSFYDRYFAIGDRLGEAFYAVWMVVISIGLLNSGDQITRDDIAYVVGVAFLVNFVWGIIDGVTVMITNIIDRVQRDRIVHDLRTRGGEAASAAALDHLDDTIVTVLDEPARRRIVAAVAKGPPGADPRKTPYWPGLGDWLYALGIIGIDVIIVIPIVAPLVLVTETATAVYVSRLIATAMFASIGAAYARNLNHRHWPAAAALGVLGFAVFTAAYETGW